MRERSERSAAPSPDVAAPAGNPGSAHETAGLRRAMGFGDVVLFFVVAIVGLRWLATAAAAGPSALVVWLIGFAGLFVPLAFAVVELSSRYPDEGGVYVWTRRAFGEFPGFLAAWMYWVSNLVYAPGLLYFMAGNALYVGGASWQGLSAEPAYFIGVSLAGIALGIGLNVVGLDVGKRLHNLGAWSTWIPVLALVALGALVWARFGSATDFSPARLIPSPRLEDLYFWSTIAFAFGGFEAASLMGAEIRDPRRSVPRAVLVAGILITAVYLLGTAAILVALPGSEVSGLQGIMQAVQRIGERLGLSGIVPPIAALISVGALGGAAAWLAATSRLLFVAGVDRHLPTAFARLHPRWGTPVVALVAQGIGAAAFVVLGQAGATVKGAYDFLVSMGVITYFVPFLLLFAAWLKLRREPAPGAGPRTPGGRPAAAVLAALGLAVTGISIVLAVFPPGEPSGRAAAAIKVAASSALVMGAGALIFARGRRGAGGAAAGRA